jgi:hypothetical protein
MAKKQKLHEPSKAAKKLVGTSLTYEIIRRGKETLIAVTVEDVKPSNSYIISGRNGKKYTGVKFKMRPFSTGKAKRAFWSGTHPDKLIKQD